MIPKDLRKLHKSFIVIGIEPETWVVDWVVVVDDRNGGLEYEPVN